MCVCACGSINTETNPTFARVQLQYKRDIDAVNASVVAKLADVETGLEEKVCGSGEPGVPAPCCGSGAVGAA